MNLLSTAITLDFDEGVDRKTLRNLAERFRTVSRARWQRARAALSYRQQSVLDLLPLIFHLNHPALPGYVHGRCPYGIDHFQPDREALAAAQAQARSFRFHSTTRKADIEALFMMGSPGTLGHSVASDLDVWLCHRPDLDDDQLQWLEAKAAAVSEWAGSLGVELHFFAMSADDWRAGRQRAEVTGENCGSAQHYLLLDEFYRTGVHLAGRMPLWWLIPAECEADYQRIARQLLEGRFVKAEQFLDFGPVPEIPEQEFLGAGVWQLYKGIDAPWKSILKLLLIECYARERQQGPLALTFKQAVYQGNTDADELDPYVMLYRRLEAWLTSAGLSKRLDLVRRALYLKAGLPLTRLDNSGRNGWRAHLLHHLVDAWGWGRAELAFLDDRQQWRAEDVQHMRRTVVNELAHSYRLLSRLARDHAVGAAISAADIGLLGRKLYAAFQRKAGKIELINPNLAPSLAEENLCFFHQSAREGGQGQQGWLLYRNLENPQEALWRPVIRRSGSLTDMLVWCHCNGLLSRATRYAVQAGSTVLTQSELRALVDALAERLPVPVSPAGRKALLGPAMPLRVMLLVNVGLDPQPGLSEKGLHKLSERHDSLEFSGTGDNLVLSVDQVQLNTWHEVSLQHYASGDVLIQCLKNYLAAVSQCSGRLPELSVHCHAGTYASGIARRVQELFDDVGRFFFAGGHGPHPLRYVIGMGRRFFVLQFSDGQPGFVALDNLGALLDYLLKPQSSYAPVIFDRYTLVTDPALRAVCHASQPGSVQVFYQFTGQQARLWVVDEHGSLCSWEQGAAQRSHAVGPLLRFLDNLLERRQLRQSLLAGDAHLTLSCTEVIQRGQDVSLERRPVLVDDLPLDGIEVQAVGVPESESGLAFDIFCGEQEFSFAEHGHQLAMAVAHYIRSLRQAPGHYPVYLTDLHLPHDLDPQSYQQDLQTCQYLAFRLRLQQALSAALERLG